jgi:hypothetical protein
LTTAAYLRGFEAIFNVARYLNVPILMLCKHVPDTAFVEAAKKTGLTHVVSRAAKDDRVVAVPCGSASDLADFAEGWAKDAVSKRLVMTEWDVPAETAPETLIGLQKKMTG